MCPPQRLVQTVGVECLWQKKIQGIWASMHKKPTNILDCFRNQEYFKHTYSQQMTWGLHFSAYCFHPLSHRIIQQGTIEIEGSFAIDFSGTRISHPSTVLMDVV